MSSELKKASVSPTFFGGIFVFVLFGLIVVILFRLMPKAETLDEKRAKARLDKLGAVQKESEAKLSGYAWANKAKGIVQLPIERAEELVLPELKAKQVAPSSVKVENPYPAGLQQPAVAPPAAAPAAAPGAPAAASPAPAAATSPTPAK